MDIYEKIKLDNDIPIKFDYLEVTKDTEKNVEKHWHRSIELLIPLEGRLRVWISGRKLEVNEGEIFIINSREIHSVERDKSRDYKGYMIQIGYDFLISCFEDMDSIYFEQIESHNIRKEILDIIEKIRFYYKDNREHKKLAIEGYLHILVYILLSNQKKVRSDGKLIESDKNRDRIIKITKYIEEHYSENLTVEMIADNFNLSYGHFVRLFKENLNVTVKEYITNIRINKSRDQLISTDYPIVHIALESGFPNIQSFYKEFNKAYNMTPAKFRKIS